MVTFASLQGLRDELIRASDLGEMRVQATAAVEARMRILDPEFGAYRPEVGKDRPAWSIERPAVAQEGRAGPDLNACACESRYQPSSFMPML